MGCAVPPPQRSLARRFGRYDESMTTTESELVRNAAGLPDEPASWRRVDEALGGALVGRVQSYLAEASDEWDVDLFFETYGRPPRDGSPWVPAIISALDFRTDISASDRHQILTDSRERAVKVLLGQK